MGFLERAIRRGVSNAVGNAVEKGVRQAVEPKIEQAAANAVNNAAGQINQAAGAQTAQQQTPQPQSTVNQAEVQQAASTLGGLFGGLTSAATDFANEAAKNMKICPSCGEAAGAEVKFCPKCGGKMPEQTVAQGAVCPSCGKQNSVGTKFCSDCGTKLPSAVAEEQAAQAKDEAALADWDRLLPQYPKWCCGGQNIEFDTQSDGTTDYCVLNISFGNGGNGEAALNQYRQLLIQNGFHQAGQYPSIHQLFKKIDGVCYCFSSENCFDGGTDYLTVYFMKQEPSGGYDYVKSEPKKSTGFKDLFGLK